MDHMKKAVERIISQSIFAARSMAASLLVFAAAMLVLATLLPLEAHAQTNPGPAPSSLIVKLVPGLTIDEQVAIVARNGGTETSTVPALRLHVIEVGSASIDVALANYRADSQVARVEVNSVRQINGVPSDPQYGNQWFLPRIGWDQVFGTPADPNANVVVAILDTGIDATHPDLAANVVPGTSVLDGSNGMTDPSGHGTMVAGTVAAATDNATGIAGVGYAGVRLLPVTVLNADGIGQDSDIINGVVWATDHGARVILMAFSNPGFSASLQEAIDYAWSSNAVLVAANGNDAANAPTFPAGDRGVIGVSATDENDALAPFSNYGSSVFLAAPGTNILTTDNVDTKYITINGTSSAAAIVAGAAAQMMAIDPTLANGVIVGRLARNADPAGTQEQTGNGRLNFARAVADTATDFVQPAGAAPLGSGGPFVGPYVAAATSMTLSPNTGASGAQVSVSTGGNPFDQNRSDIGIYWDGTTGQTIGLLLTTCSTGGNSRNINSGCSFIVPSGATPGPHTVVATQKSSLSKSVSSTFTLTVTQATSTTTVSCPAGVSYTGSALTPCTASFTTSDGLTGSLSVAYSNNVNAGTATASATYAGDATHASSSNSATFAITQAASTTMVSCPASVTYNGAAQTPCTVSVTGAGGLLLSPEPTYANNTNVGTATASYAYAGDGNHTGSQDSKSFAIDKAPTTTAIASSANPATADDNVFFTATVTTGATGSIQFIIDGTDYGAPVAVANGTATVAFAMKTAGTYTVAATYSGDANHSGSSGTLVPDQQINPGAPAALAFATGPTDTQAGQAITPSVTVRILDAAGNLVTTDSSSVTIVISAGGVLQAGSTTTVAAAGGVAAFGNLKPTKAGTFTLHATDATLAAADSTTFNVSPGAAVTFAFDVPASITAGESFDITMYASDTFGNIATGYTGTVHFTSSDPNATLPSDVQFIAADAGVKALPASTILTTAGNQTITATDIAPSGVKGTSPSITVDAGDATVLVVTAPPAIETAGLPFTVTVEARDAYGNRATGYAGTLVFYINDPKADKLNDYTFGGTDQGFHAFSVTLHSAGQWTVKATDTAANIYGESGTITVQPGPPAKLAFKSQPGNTFVGVAIPSFAVEVRDADDNVVENAEGNVPITIGIGANPTHVATLNGTATVDAVDGVETFSGLMLDKAASGYTMVASSDPLEGATSGAFDVGKGTATLALGNLNQTYDGLPKSVTVTTTPAGLSGVSVTYSGSGSAPTNAGSYSVVASLANPDYEATNATGTLVVAKADATIVATPYSLTYDGNAHTAIGTATGVKGETLSGLVLTGTTHTNAGDYPADPWTFTDASGNYNNASGTVHDSIARANATISVTPYGVTYDGNTHAATGSATGVKGEALSGLVLTGTTHTNAADYAADPWTFTDSTGNYNNASGAVHDAIAKAPSAVSVTGGTFTYDATPHAASAIVSGVGAGIMQVVSWTYTPPGDSTVPTNAGAYAVTATYAGDVNHMGSFGSAGITITQAPSMTSVSVASAFFDGKPHGGSASVTGVGGLNQALTVDYAGVSGTTYGPAPMPPSAIGLYQATANFAGDANHLSSSNSKAFNIVGINIAGPAGPIAKGNPASLTVTLVGAASGYPIACTIDWTDGTVDNPSGVGTCSASHTYAGAGVYEPKVSVSSSALTGTSGGTVQYVVIYDASAGFVTGGGWIISPVGAYAANPSLTGKANFGFVSKYQKGANVPTGNTEFQFQAANFNFKSTAYEWLVISGAKAQYKGSGTINGVGDYGFMLTGIDGSAGGGADKLRLKVWDKGTNATIYDNQIGADDTADPSTALGGGSIVVHK